MLADLPVSTTGILEKSIGNPFEKQGGLWSILLQSEVALQGLGEASLKEQKRERAITSDTYIGLVTKI